MKTEITETIEIPSILKKELEPIAKKQGQDFKQFILSLILRGIDDLEDENLKDKIDYAIQSGRLGEEESLKLLDELKS